jgi:hypothetical protein
MVSLIKGSLFWWLGANILLLGGILARASMGNALGTSFVIVIQI